MLNSHPMRRTRFSQYRAALDMLQPIPGCAGHASANTRLRWTCFSQYQAALDMLQPIPGCAGHASANTRLRWTCTRFYTCTCMCIVHRNAQDWSRVRCSLTQISLMYLLASFPGREKMNGLVPTARVLMRMLAVTIIQIGIWKHTRSKYTKAIKVCCL